ncbi:purine nucleoside phosphorylase-like [Chrysoperla carnea]|uniref:purine nucleoside phosphorylase-like n=1 Tax=Chrysoperla carnea TaxID=189513 RepID=UPI001D093605|nr:purine nucleoside phosphorylase-like [Chrysoperla carnea]
MSVVKCDKCAPLKYESLIEAADYIKTKISFTPKVGIICGTGLGLVGKIVENAIPIKYEEIPNFPVSGVEGHAGQLLLGYLSGVPVMVMQGRTHHYEGYPLWKCALPVRVMKLLGVTHLIVSNAAGGVNPKLNVGDIMLIKDHVNFMGFTGNNPLQGLNDKRFGPRFLSLTNAYNKKLIQIGKEVAEELNIENRVKDGIFTCLGGPNFETPAEINFLKLAGIDAVGMSTIYEVITARHCEMEVLAFSLITNITASEDNSDLEHDHDQNVDVGKSNEGLLQCFVKNVVEKINKL